MHTSNKPPLLYLPSESAILVFGVVPTSELRARQVISPFCDKDKLFGLSYGESYAGYDIRMDGVFKRPKFSLLKRLASKIFNKPLITVGEFDKIEYEEIVADEYIIPARGFVLSSSVEYFEIPDDMFGVTYGKSTLARVGIRDICTILEGGWKGHLTLEIYNYGNYPVRLRRGMAITQTVFYRRDASGGSYSGKYQGQTRKPIEALNS